MIKLKVILISFLFLASCDRKNELLNGHWHEYVKNNSDYVNCYHITDSIITANPYTYNSDYFRGTEIKQSEIISEFYDYFFSTSDFILRNDKIILNDSIHWKKQSNTKENFITDFSSNLLLDIKPFEDNNSTFDFQTNKTLDGAFIYIGKLKKSKSKKFNQYDTNKYYIQLNDRVVDNIDEIALFLCCNHCNYNRQKIFLHADKNTPKELLLEIESKIINRDRYNRSQRRRKQIFYLVIDIQNRIAGYKTATNIM